MPIIGPSIQNGESDDWFLDIYSLDSSICAAAIHAGIISEQTGGNVI